MQHHIRTLWLLVLVLLLLVTSLPTTPAVQAQEPPLPWRDKSEPFGMVATVGNRVRADEHDAIVSLLVEAGVQWQREEIFWHEVQQAPDDPFTWDGNGQGFYDYDTAIQKQHDAGIQLLGLLDYNPAWFKGQTPPLDAWINDWGDFVYAAVARYGRDRGQIKVWELWNEPNVRQFGYEAGLYEIRDYVRVLEVGAAAVRAADPEARVMMAGMSGMFSTDRDFEYDGYTYLDEIGRLGGWDYVDIIAHHPYHAIAPEQPINRFGRLVTLRDELAVLDELMRKYGPKPVWITEKGWTTVSIAPGVSEQNQALYLVRGYILTLGHPSVEKFFWYDFRNDTSPFAAYDDPEYNRREAEFHYGILRRTYPLAVDDPTLRKPAFIAFRTMTGELGDLLLTGILADDRTPETEGLFWYRFTGAGAQTDVVWRMNERHNPLTYPCGCNAVEVIGWDGQTRGVYRAVDGTVSLELDAPGYPVYLRYR